MKKKCTRMKAERQYIDVLLKNLDKQALLEFAENLPNDSVFTLLSCRGLFTSSFKRFDESGRIIKDNFFLAFFNKLRKLFVPARIRCSVRMDSGNVE